MINLWRPKIIVPLSLLLGLHVSITTPLWQYVDTLMSADFTDKGWLKMKRATRWYVGHFSEPPSDSEMIEYFNGNRQKFEKLVSSYYEVVREPGRQSIMEQVLMSERMDIGIYSFGIAGPALFRDANASFVFNTGVSLSLIDSGPSPWWSLGRRTYKEYVYIPEFPTERTKNRTPVEKLLATGEYQSLGDADVQFKPGVRAPCILKTIDSNWFIQRCIKNWD